MKFDFLSVAIHVLMYTKIVRYLDLCPDKKTFYYYFRRKKNLFVGHMDQNIYELGHITTSVIYLIEYLLKSFVVV